MALTSEQKIALRDWLQANIHKAIQMVTYREGIKDVDGKPVYAEGTREVPVYADPVPPADDTTPIPDPVQTGTVEETYQYRTYIERTVQMIQREEIVLRVQAKARKHGYDVTLEQVEDFLKQYKDTIVSWIPDVSWGGGRNRAYSSYAEIDAEDPDV